MAVLRQGDPEGNRMVVRLETRGGTTIHAIGVPQDRPSRTGPTWAYVFENDGLTLLDPGAFGAYDELADGITAAGFAVRDIDRVILSHGHSDHDGSTAQVVSEAGASLWAHGVYASLLPYDPWEVQDREASGLHAEMVSLMRRETPVRDRDANQWRNGRYLESRKGIKVDHATHHGERFGDAQVIHAPGHSPDELCLTLDGVVFTGDHILPEITPHPTTKAPFKEGVARHVPAEYRESATSFGLERYMRSLGSVMELGPSLSVLPAHRLYNRNKFNFLTLRRAEEIIRHHARRLAQILQRATDEPTTLEQVTRGIFQRGKLIGGNLFMAMSEVVAHVELLQDVGDLELTRDRRLRKTGSANYKQLVSELID
jgi:glyoxylase-like metal-dependent hydrolase (beta-lactamase superfamily II)